MKKLIASILVLCGLVLVGAMPARADCGLSATAPCWESQSPILTVTAAPAVTASSYTTGNCYGGLQTLTGAVRVGTNSPGTALLQSVQITDVSGQDAAVDVVIMNANPTNSTFTDHSACTVNTADVTKVIRVVHVTDCTLLSASAPGMCQAPNLAEPIVLGSGVSTLYAVGIVRGTPTPTGVGNITYRYNLLPQ